MLIVKTNGGRNAKLLVHPAAQKTDATHSVPTLLIDRYVTYKEGEERTLLATGKNLALFPGFRLSLDMGQVVPGSWAATCVSSWTATSPSSSRSARRSCIC